MAGPLLRPEVAALMLTLLLSLQSVTTDLMLTALPSLGAELHAPMALLQYTLSASVLGFGLAQLVWGPVADRFGRRPVMLLGLAGYLLASVGAGTATSIGAVIAWRAAQGATMAASVVCARAMVRDLYEPYQGTLVMARALTGLGVVAILCPLLGGVVVAAFGWRAAIASMTVYALGLAWLVVTRLPETARQLNPQSTQAGPLLRQALAILRHPVFRAWTLLTACTYGALYTCLAASGVVLIQVLGLPVVTAGVVLSAMGMSYIAGTLQCRRWLARHAPAGTVARAAGFSLAAALMLAVVAWLDLRSVPALMVPICLFAFGHGMHQACGQAGLVGPFPHAAGLASALSGFVLALVAFGVGAWLGRALDGTVRALALGMSVGGVLTALVAWTLVQRHGRLPAGAAAEAAKA